MVRNCVICNCRKAALKRPKTGEMICKECFFYVFETEIHTTIINNKLFRRGEKVAIAASGGKDSTVLAHVLCKLNKQYDYGLELCLLSVDEGITGYRDDSLECVKRNQRLVSVLISLISDS
jgi:cytoplasmic tRNA 2-thiolation protein 1